MKHRHTPFRHVLDQMTHDLAEAVLDAVRQAVRAAMLGESPSFNAPPSFAMSVSQAVARAPLAAAPVSPPPALSAPAPAAGSKASASPRRATPSGSRSKARVVAAAPADFDDSMADEPNDAMIIDPLSMLAALESAAVRQPEAAPRVHMPVSPLLRNRDEEEREDEGPPSEVPVPRTSTAFAPRTGEEVIRTNNGGLVLRRRRNSASPAA